MEAEINTTSPNGPATCPDLPGDQPTDNAVCNELIFSEDSDTDSSEHSVENTPREDQLSKSPSEEGISEHTTERIDEDPVRDWTLSGPYAEDTHGQPQAKRQRVDHAPAFAPTDSSIATAIKWRQPDKLHSREDILLKITGGTTILGIQRYWTFHHICWKCSSLHFYKEHHKEKMHQQLLRFFGPSTSWAPWPQTKDRWDYALILDNIPGYLSIRHVSGEDMHIYFTGTETSSLLAIELLRMIKNSVEVLLRYEQRGGAPIVKV